MTANNSKSYLPYLNKLVDQYNNIHHQKNHIDADYFALTENIQTNSSKSLKLMVESELQSIRIILVKLLLLFLKQKLMKLRIKFLITLNILLLKRWISSQEKKFESRLKQADLVNKTDFYNKLTSFNRKTSSNETKYLEIRKKTR